MGGMGGTGGDERGRGWAWSRMTRLGSAELAGLRLSLCVPLGSRRKGGEGLGRLGRGAARRGAAESALLVRFWGIVVFYVSSRDLPNNEGSGTGLPLSLYPLHAVSAATPPTDVQCYLFFSFADDIFMRMYDVLK